MRQLFLVAALASVALAQNNKVPRMADGHPDLSGVWWRGADVGGRGPGAPVSTAAAPAAPAKTRVLPVTVTLTDNAKAYTAAVQYILESAARRSPRHEYMDPVTRFDQAGVAQRRQSQRRLGAPQRGNTAHRCHAQLGIPMHHRADQFGHRGSRRGLVALESRHRRQFQVEIAIRQ